MTSANQGSPDLASLNGLRALSSMAVCALHGFYMWGFLMPNDLKAQLVATHPFVWMVCRGVLSVDFLLTISSALAVYTLLPRLEGGKQGGAPSAWAAVKAYWTGRVRRILPGYMAANAFIVAIIGSIVVTKVQLPVEAIVANQLCLPGCLGKIWHNFIFATNQLGPLGCGVHFWTTSIQVQFFVAIPLLLLALRPRAAGFRGRLAVALAALAAVGTALRAWAVYTSEGLELPVGDLTKPEVLASWVTLLQATYLSTTSRIAQLAMGAALGLVLRSHAALSWLKHRSLLVSVAALTLQAAYLRQELGWHLFRLPGEAPWPLERTQSFALFGLYGSPLVSAFVCATILALVLHSDPLHAAAARLLAHPAFTPLANVSYGLYLHHELAKFVALLLVVPQGLLPALVARAPVAGLAAMVAGTLAAGYAAAVLSYNLVEKRF